MQTNAKEVLQVIKKKGLSQSILSAMNQSDLEKLVEFYGLSKFFIKIIGLNNHYASGKIENGKNWIKELSYNSKEILMIGDTFHDYEVAKEMQVDCVLLTIGHHPKEKLENCGVPLLKSLKEVLNFV